MTDAPIACSLSAGAFKTRIAAIAELNRDALRSQERNDLTLVLSYAPEALARVHEMVRRERACCAFLDFQIVEETSAVVVCIVAPEEARVAAESLYEEFVTGDPRVSHCGCS